MTVLMFRLIKGRGKYGDSIRDSGEEYNETISTLHILIREAVKLERKSSAIRHETSFLQEKNNLFQIF